MLWSIFTSYAVDYAIYIAMCSKVDQLRALASYHPFRLSGMQLQKESPMMNDGGHPFDKALSSPYQACLEPIHESPMDGCFAWSGRETSRLVAPRDNRPTNDNFYRISNSFVKS